MSPSLLQYCVVPTGSALPYISSYDCPPVTVCDDSGEYADCISTAVCVEGDVQCLSTTVVRTCTAGAWVESTCPRTCVSTALGDQCGLDIPTRTTTGVVRYETRGPNAAYTDWAAAPSAVVGQGFLLGSYRCPGGLNCQLIDAVVTTGGGASVGGRFSIAVPTVPTADDYLWVAAAGVGADGQTLTYAVVNPGFLPSTTARAPDEAAPDPSLWSWFFGASGRVAGDELLITEGMGSGAARILDYTRYVYHATEDFYLPYSPQSLVVWLGGPDVTWTCGACASPAPAWPFGEMFSQQVFFPNNADWGYYSDAVTAHEFGHYVMAAYGRRPNEGGAHMVGVPVNPGMAWSEGWATFFSSDVRSSDYYYDKQRGGFFWMDLRSRYYGGSVAGAAWHRPSAAAGLTQTHDENDVASMLLSLRDTLPQSAFWETLRNPQIMDPGPFGRGYTRRVWTDPLHPELYTPTDQESLFLADYLDALVCSGAASAATIDDVTVPATYYPYPSGSPLCR